MVFFIEKLNAEVLFVLRGKLRLALNFAEIGPAESTLALRSALRVKGLMANDTLRIIAGVDEVINEASVPVVVRQLACILVKHFLDIAGARFQTLGPGLHTRSRDPS